MYSSSHYYLLAYGLAAPGAGGSYHIPEYSPATDEELKVIAGEKLINDMKRQYSVASLEQRLGPVDDAKNENVPKIEHTLRCLSDHITHNPSRSHNIDSFLAPLNSNYAALQHDLLKRFPIRMSDIEGKILVAINTLVNLIPANEKESHREKYELKLTEASRQTNEQKSLKPLNDLLAELNKSIQLNLKTELARIIAILKTTIQGLKPSRGKAWCEQATATMNNLIPKNIMTEKDLFALEDYAIFLDKKLQATKTTPPVAHTNYSSSSSHTFKSATRPLGIQSATVNSASKPDSVIVHSEKKFGP